MIIPIIAVGILTVIASLWSLTRSELHPDLQFFLYKSKMLVNGKELFADYYDINSPLIFDYTNLIYRISEFTGISLEVTFTLFSYFLVFLCLVAVIKLIKDIYKNTYFSYALIFVISTKLLFSGKVFFQRDYIIALVAVLYLFSLLKSITTHGKNNFSFPAGILLGIVVLLKPHFILVPLGLEISALLLRKKKASISISREMLGYIAGSLLGLLIIYIFHAGYFEFFIKMSPVYLHYSNQSFPKDLLMSGTLILLMPFIISFNENSKYKDLLVIFSFFYISALLSGFLQNKGFAHHYFLAYTCSAIAALLLIVVFIRKHDLKFLQLAGILRVSLAVVTVLFVFTFSYYLPYNVVYEHASDPEFEKMVNFTNTYAKDSYFAFFATNYHPFTNLEYVSQSESSMRYFNLWFIPGFYKDQLDNNEIVVNSPDRMSELELETYRNTIEDIMSKDTKIIFVDNRRYKSGFMDADFSHIEYYSQDESFRQFFESYDFYQTVYYEYFDAFVKTQ